MDVSRRDRFVGCLLGQCVGDALGFVVEGYPAVTCADYVDDVLRQGRAGTVGRDPFPFGQYTDDSQLARELLQSLVARRGFDPTDYAARVAAIFAEDRIVGRGHTTEAAALRLALGAPWDRAGTPAPAAGNGSAMRAAPIGLLFSGDWVSLIDAAHDQGRITHADPRCSAGAVAIAGAVGLVVAGQDPEPATMLERLAQWASRFDRSFADDLVALVDWVALAPAKAAEVIRVAGSIGADSAWDGISPFVVPSVLWSLYAFLRTPNDYWETICTAIAVGGDVDTTAAMAGAVSGAYLGVDAVPTGLADSLRDRGTWGRGALVALAEEASTMSVIPRTESQD